MRHILNRLKELFEHRHDLARQMKWLLRNSKIILVQLILLFAADLAISGITVGATLLNKRLIDGASGTGHFRGEIFALLVGLTALNITLSAASRYMEKLLQERMAFSVREKLFEHVLRSRWENVKERHSGDILTRLTSDIDSIASGITSLIPNLLSFGFRTVLAFSVLFSFDRFLALAALVLGPLVVLTGLLFSGRLRALHIQLRENESRYRSFMQESSERILVIKTFCSEEEYARRLAEIRAERMRLVRARGRVSTLMRVSMTLLFNSGYLLAFGWGIFQISRGSITYGTMSVFLSLVNQVEGPVTSIGNIIPSLISVLASVGRVEELETVEEEERLAPAELSGAIGVRFSRVSFAYEDDEPVLKDVNLEIRPGETVGLIGETGAGKTTAARLLLALTRPTEGTIELFDENDTAETVSASSRRLIAYVPQGNTLSSGTIRENLEPAGKRASEDEIREALRCAEAYGFIEELPKKLDTVIGENGTGLSEGQAQRVAIARALLRKAPVLILDEASASLDMQTEQKIMENLKAATLRVTCLVITHRPSMLELCDRCFKVTGTDIIEVK